MTDDNDQDTLDELQVMGLIARGKVRADVLPAERRSEIMRALSRMRKTRAGGRPRTVPHNPGPRGGCRCAACREERKTEKDPSAG